MYNNTRDDKNTKILREIVGGRLVKTILYVRAYTQSGGGERAAGVRRGRRFGDPQKTERGAAER